MLDKVETQNPKIETALRVIVLALVVSGIGQYYFLTQPKLVHLGALLGLWALAIGLASRTTIGKGLWALWQGALVEIRKVVWPNKKETIQMTILVIVVVLLAGASLWIADALLFKLVAWITGYAGVPNG